MLESRRRERLKLGDRFRVLLQNGRGDRELRLALEGAAAGGHLEEQGAEGEDVGTRIGLTAFDLLRAHVLVGSYYSAGHGDGGSGRRLRHGSGECGQRTAGSGGAQTRWLSEAEIHELGAGRGEHHVARLEVAVHDALAMGLVEGVGDFDADL